MPSNLHPVPAAYTGKGVCLVLFGPEECLPDPPLVAYFDVSWAEFDDFEAGTLACAVTSSMGQRIDQ